MCNDYESMAIETRFTNIRFAGDVFPGSSITTTTAAAAATISSITLRF